MNTTIASLLLITGLHGNGAMVATTQPFQMQVIHAQQWAAQWQQPRLSPYDHLVKKYAHRHKLDWTLVTAQMYQESRFNPQARSFAGAKGLMQLMPGTARELGYEDLFHPETNIQAGTAYLKWLKKRFPRLPAKERVWFVLAAYNAGVGHVYDAQRLARRLGLRTDRWFGHVEKAMLLLSKPRYARKARHGFVRGREPVTYVRNIRRYHRQYAKKINT